MLVQGAAFFNNSLSLYYLCVAHTCGREKYAEERSLAEVSQHPSNIFPLQQASTEAVSEELQYVLL